jgi:hypothetical protein
VRNKKAYLFLGPSGAGKTTICSLSKKTQVIDDDIIPLAKIKGRACIYNIRKGKFYPIRYIFIILQAKRNRIKKASATEILRFMLKDSVIAFRRNGTKGLKQKAKSIFNFVMDMLQSVACYKLYFKKNGSFWKIIDKLECNYNEPYAKNLIRAI